MSLTIETAARKIGVAIQRVLALRLTRRLSILWGRVTPADSANSHSIEFPHGPVFGNELQ